MAAGLFQLLGPEDVIFLVKPGLQLHQHGNLFPVFRRRSQSRDDGGISADPVKGLLDGQHIWILCRRPDEIHHRIEAFIGMHQQDISLPDIGEDIVVIHQRRYWLGRVSRRL